MTRNSSWRERALALFPGGSNGEFGIPADRVPVIARGNGCRVWDTENREFIDMTMGWGSVLVGHARREVLDAAAAAARDGANFAAVNRRSVELAERIASIVPCAERVRFVASGTEATMLCLRVARAATGRRKVLKFEGAYHGQHPVGVASMLNGQPSALPAPDPSGSGDPSIAHDLLVAPFNDLERTSRIVAEHASDLAAIIVEPVHRCIAPAEGFLPGLRELASRHGVVLVFDEVVTGFRLALGGAQEFYGVVPDMAAYGKALGGGFPIGAFAGRAELMDVVNEARLPGPRYAWSASTTGGNPVSCAAAMATLDVLSAPGTHAHLHKLGAALRSRLQQGLADAGETGQTLGEGPLAQIAFSARPVRDQESWLASDRARARRLMIELIQQGVFLNPLGTKLYISIAHDETALDMFAERFTAALHASRS